MKRILLSGLAILLAIGLMGGAFAFFSDTEQSTANSLEVGTLDLKIRDGGEDWGDSVIVAEWTMSNMEPGVPSDSGIIGIRNDGTIAPDHVVISASYEATEGPPTGDMDTVDQDLEENWDDFAKYLEITYLKYYAGAWYIEYDGTSWTTYGSPPVTAGYATNDWEIADGGDWVSLKDFRYDPLDNLPPPGINTLSPTWFEMTVLFRSDAPNALQGDTLDLTLTFTLNQDSGQ